MTFVLVAACLYLVASGLLARRLGRGDRDPSSAVWLPASVAIALHAFGHAVDWKLAGGANLHFFSALSLVSLGMAGLTLLVAARGRLGALGVIVFPIAGVMAAVYGVWGRHGAATPMDWRIQLHAWCALLAYATLALAALVAVLSWAQERALRQRDFRSWLRSLPPLVELETLLFRMIAVGFALLSAALLTGALFVEDLMAQHLAHKTVFSVLSWLAFGALLVGRWRRGWRGTKAVRWTLVAMTLLVLAYFGSSFVLQMILRRA